MTEPTEATEAVVDSTAEEVVVRPDVEQDVFLAMDAMDEAQILDALQGRPSQVMVYSFGTGRNQKTGLSYAGVAECVRTMNVEGHTRIRVTPQPPIVEEFQEQDEKGELVSYFRVSVYAEDEKNGGGQWGMATQRKFQTFRDSSKKPELDNFALTKALSKAQRNAMLPLVPVEFREVVIAQAMKDEARVRQIRSGGAGQLAELPPPLTDERSQQQRERAREVFREIQAVNRLAILPAQFHANLARVEHDHKRLDEFIVYLEERLLEAKGGAA